MHRRMVLLMARKVRTCPHFTRRTVGKWLTMTCTIRQGESCPDSRCQARSEYQETVPDAGE